MSESDQSGSKQNGAVGYGRPPVNRQFKPGQSGNPRGRPKGSKNLATTFAEVLSRRIKVRDKNGKIRMLTKLEAIIESISNKALGGDANAFAKVIQLAEKFDMFNRLTVNHREVINSALLELNRKIAALPPPEEQETTPPKESQNSQLNLTQR